MTHTKESILELLRTNDKAVGRALVALNERQTYSEQTDKMTKNQNGRGFRPCHARMGTSMAEFFSRNGYLSEKQARYWRAVDKSGNMRIGIYANQLLQVVAEKQAAKAA